MNDTESIRKYVKALREAKDKMAEKVRMEVEEYRLQRQEQKAQQDPNR